MGANRLHFFVKLALVRDESKGAPLEICSLMDEAAMT